MIAVACLTPVLRRKMAAAIGLEHPRHRRKIERTSDEGIKVWTEFTQAVTRNE